MNIKLLLMCLLIHLNSWSQTNMSDLQGSWVKTKVEMADGSKHLPYYSWGNRYIEYVFFKNSYKKKTNPERKEGVGHSFTVEGNKLIISEHLELVIESLKNDSLVFYENIKGRTKDKIRRYYLTRKIKLKEDYLSKVKSIDTIIAKPFFVPIFYGNLDIEISDKSKAMLDSFFIKGELIIDKSEKKVDAIFTSIIRDSNDVDKSLFKLSPIIYEDWRLEGFENYQIIKIPFFSYVKNYKKITYSKFKLFGNSLTDIYAGTGRSYEVISKGAEYFKKGLKALSKRKYKSAINYFSKSYEIDRTLIDALYNRAAVYYSIGQKEMSCKDWKRLKDLGQVQGRNLYNQNCIE